MKAIKKAQKIADKMGDPLRRSIHGCVIYKGGSMLSWGVNDHKPHPTWGVGYSNALHAEVMAIKDATRRGISLKGAKLFVCRLNGLQTSHPCPDCMDKIREAGIKRIIYTDKNGEILRETV